MIYTLAGAQRGAGGDGAQIAKWRYHEQLGDDTIAERLNVAPSASFKRGGHDPVSGCGHRNPRTSR